MVNLAWPSEGITRSEATSGCEPLGHAGTIWVFFLCHAQQHEAVYTSFYWRTEQLVPLKVANTLHFFLYAGDGSETGPWMVQLLHPLVPFFVCLFLFISFFSSSSSFTLTREELLISVDNFFTASFSTRRSSLWDLQEPPAGKPSWALVKL